MDVTTFITFGLGVIVGFIAYPIVKHFLLGKEQ